MPRSVRDKCSARISAVMRTRAPPMIVVTFRYRFESENGTSSALPARTKHSAVLNTIGVKPGSTRTRGDDCIHQPNITTPPRSASKAPPAVEGDTGFIANCIVPTHPACKGRPREHLLGVYFLQDM